jgi:hypothetical protein
METIKQGFWKSFREKLMGGVTLNEKKKCVMDAFLGMNKAL